MLVKTMNAWVVVLNIVNALFVVSAINSCPLGTYVTEDAQGCALCPEGRYGDVLTNKDKECSGVCDEGYFCPPGSTSPKQQYCSSESLSSSSARFYCSKGRRNLVSPGHYTWPDCSCDLNVASYTGVIQNVSSLLDGFEVSTLVDNIKTTNEAQKIFHSDEGMPQWLSFDFHAANPTLPYGNDPIVCSYSISVASHLSEKHPDACAWDAPKSWRLEGAAASNVSQDKYFPNQNSEDILWKTLHTVINETGWSCGETRQFHIPSGNLSKYTSYRFIVDSVVGRPESVGEGSYLVLSELSLFISNGADTRRRSEQRPCEPGYFCIGPGTKVSSDGKHQTQIPLKGIRRKCPEGTYGISTELKDDLCSGVCEAGTYCPAGTISPLPCPKGYYCPDGHAKYPCPPGRYGSSTSLRSPLCTGLCDKGYYCPSKSTNSKQIKCPVGFYGDTLGLTSELCSGECLDGYYCSDDQDNVSPTPSATKCRNAKEYCPKGSASPILVDAGYYTLGGSDDGSGRTHQLICPKGTYCIDGIKIDCAPGTFSDVEQLSSPCKTLCPAGSWCSGGTVKPSLCPKGVYGLEKGLAQDTCSDRCPSGYYCPAGTINPTANACPAGTIGSTIHDASGDGLGSLEECNGSKCNSGYCESSICPVGHYCNSATATASDAKACGHVSFYCPAGSESPNNSQPGYYTVGGTPITRHAQRICPMGYWCNTGVKQLCSAGYFGSSEGLSTKQCSGICPAGYFCPPGTKNGKQHPCPLGLFSSSGVASSRCSGKCDPGYWCGRGSTSPTENSCGSANVYCPKGSGSPQKASEGYYTFPLSGSPSQANIANRVMQNICVKGNYCTGGIKYTCPPGTYGSIEGLSTSKCSGLCPMGHYCPEETTVPIPCPQGVYGNTQGLKTSACSSRCNPRQKCNLGTINPNST